VNKSGLIFFFLLEVFCSNLLLCMRRISKFEYDAHKHQLQKFLQKTKCDDTKPGNPQVKFFGLAIMNLFKQIRATNGMQKIIESDLLFDHDDTVFTQLAKSCCPNTNCVNCVKKFYFLLKAPEDDAAKQLLGVSLKDGQTLFSIACKRGLYTILGFLLNRKFLVPSDLSLGDKRCMEQHDDVLPKLLDKELFDSLRETNFGIEPCDIVEQAFVGQDIEALETVFAKGFDAYICYFKAITDFYIQSGVSFDYKMVRKKLCEQIDSTEKHITQGKERLARLSRYGFTPDVYYLELSNHSCMLLRDICKDVCKRLQILYYATDKIKTLYDLTIFTRS